MKVTIAVTQRQIDGLSNAIGHLVATAEFKQSEEGREAKREATNLYGAADILRRIRKIAELTHRR